MSSPWPSDTEMSLEEFAASQGWTVVNRFGDRTDSRSVVLGIETERGRYIVKHAADAEAIAWLESGLRFHSEVEHPAIPTVVHHLTTGDGFALVEEWGPGEILVDSYDPSVLPPDHPFSAYRRFLGLPAPVIVRAIEQIIDAHVAVAEAGFVAVDLYDGCVLFDFGRQTVRLIDLDHYRPGPYVLDVDRQLGSSSYMAPEEFTRGATIDERTTLYTLGRMALVYLGCARKADARRGDFRGSARQFEIATACCCSDPRARLPTVRALHEAWTRAVSPIA
jgi:serine/threonine protein kinase